MTQSVGVDNPNERIDVVGVDGWRGGWVAAAVTPAGLQWSTHPTFAGLLDAFPAAHVGVDMPIGLPAQGYRACDLAARVFLGRARSSIFLTPTRAQVGQWFPGAAHPIGIGISRQTWNLLPKIVELDEILADRPENADRVAEVHPECSFRMLAPEIRFDSKKTARGVGQRLTTLRRWRELPDLTDAPAGVPTDDVLDAAVVAWTTQRWFERVDSLHTFGSGELDDHGRRMSIMA